MLFRSGSILLRSAVAPSVAAVGQLSSSIAVQRVPSQSTSLRFLRRSLPLLTPSRSDDETCPSATPAAQCHIAHLRVPPEARPVPLDVPADKVDDAKAHGATFNNILRCYTCEAENAHLLRHYGTHMRIFLEVPRREYQQAQTLGAFWSPEFVQWYSHPSLANHEKLCSLYQVKRLPVDVPAEHVADAREEGLRWDPSTRSWYVLESDPRKDELMDRFNGRRVYLRVGNDERQQALELGCKWDPVVANWYTVTGSPRMEEIRATFSEVPRPPVRGQFKRKV
eukprot:TRINITY_DN56350_c0_g1_i1.p1 TRINITY_DN56350_c0_g1~~TRINITY_DN56350_c0_g1_i1.p1  ORF type:complete len:281 (+),score=49.35 TRINITY_DN56350_c0_g1_i1:53-895(+)